ncbi:MAG: hypothetical protein R8M14_00595 [Ghiorsea sp.]
MRFLLFFICFFSFLAPQVAMSEIGSTTDKVVEKFMALDLDETAETDAADTNRKEDTTGETIKKKSVSLEEYQTMVLERMNERFKLMDADEDGEVTEEEYRKFWTEQKSQYYRPRRK